MDFVIAIMLIGFVVLVPTTMSIDGKLKRITAK